MTKKPTAHDCVLVDLAPGFNCEMESKPRNKVCASHSYKSVDLVRHRMTAVLAVSLDYAWLRLSAALRLGGTCPALAAVVLDNPNN